MDLEENTSGCRNTSENPQKCVLLNFKVNQERILDFYTCAKTAYLVVTPLQDGLQVANSIDFQISSCSTCLFKLSTKQPKGSYKWPKRPVGWEGHKQYC